MQAEYQRASVQILGTSPPRVCQHSMDYGHHTRNIRLTNLKRCNEKQHDSLKIAGAGNKEQLQNYLLIWNGTLSKFVERKRDCLCSTRPPTAWLTYLCLIHSSHFQLGTHGSTTQRNFTLWFRTQRAIREHSSQAQLLCGIVFHPVSWTNQTSPNLDKL